MVICEPSIEVKDGKTKIICGKYVAKEIIANINQPYTLITDNSIAHDPVYHDCIDFCFVLPHHLKGLIPEGHYEYEHNEGYASGLQDSVIHQESGKSYERQYCGANGDDEYEFLLALWEINNALGDLLDQKGRNRNCVMEKVPGTTNHLRARWVDKFVQDDWFENLVPGILRVDLEIEGEIKIENPENLSPETRKLLGV